MTVADPESRTWWGESEIPSGGSLAWLIGPLRLRVSRLEGEWRVVYQPGEGHEDRVEVARPCSDVDVREGDSILRFAVDGKTDRLALVPLTADRTVVSRPTEPFHVLPRQRARLYVSSPLWVGLDHETGRLCEIPITRPPDTWTGSTTGEGEAAYASRTFCRLRLRDVPFRPHRAVTPVVVENRATDPLALERVAIAVPYLSLYRGADGILWTEEVRLAREAEEDEVEMAIAPGAPEEARAGTLVGGPRVIERPDRLRRALGTFF